MFTRLGLRSVALSLTLVLFGCDSQNAEDHLAQGIASAEAGEYNTAVIGFKNALQKNPDLAEARYRLGVLYEWGGGYESALKELERALDLGYERQVLLPSLLRAKIGVGRYSEVLGELDSGEGLSPPLTAIKGMALEAAGNREAALSSFENALGSDPRTLDALVGSARLLATSDLESAYERSKVATEVDPRSREAWLVRSRIEQRLGLYEEAVSSFDRVSELPNGEAVGAIGAIETILQNPDVALEERIAAAKPRIEQVLRIFPGFVEALYAKGLVAFLQGDSEGAIDSLREASSRGAEHAPTLFLYGVALFEQGQPNQSADLLRRYLNIARPGTNQTVAARKVLATIQIQRNDLEGAIETLTEEIGELDAQALAMLGDSYRRVGDAQNATVYLRRAVSVAPDVDSFRRGLALSLIAGGSTDQAIAELEAGLSPDANWSGNEELLIRLYLREGNAEAARNLAMEMTDSEPESPVGPNLLGLVDLEVGNYAEATAAFERALAIKFDYAPAVENLAQVSLLQGRRGEALVFYRRLLELAPGHEAAGLAVAFDAETRGAPAEALAALRNIRAENDGAVEARRVLAQRLIVAGEPEEAALVADEAVELAPTNPRVRLVKAQADAANGRAGAAVSELWKLIDEGEELPRNAFILLARLEASLDRSDRGVAALDLWLEANSDDIDAAIFAGTLEQSVDLEAAQARYERLMPDFEQNPILLNNLAWIYGELGDPRAESTARQAYELAPESAAVADTLGWVLTRKGRYPEAVPYLQFAADASDRNPTISYHLGVALAESGDGSGALKILKASIEEHAEFPEREEAIKLIADLEDV